MLFWRWQEFSRQLYPSHINSDLSETIKIQHFFNLIQTISLILNISKEFLLLQLVRSPSFNLQQKSADRFIYNLLGYQRYEVLGGHWLEIGEVMKLNLKNKSFKAFCKTEIYIVWRSATQFPQNYLKQKTAWKVSAFGVFLVRFQSRCGKVRTRKTPNTDTFYAKEDGNDYLVLF